MRVLIAPDKFKGTLSARRAAATMRAGVLQVLPDADVTCMPMADGGEGTVEVLATVRNARNEVIHAEDRNGTFDFPIARLGDGSICVEVASTSGRQPRAGALAASSLRTGEAMRALYALKPARVLVGVGGSASTDGGTGIAVAHGWRFLDRGARELQLGGGALVELDGIDDHGAEKPPCEVIGLCDVANPLLGPSGAANTFAPQKGATPEEVAALEAGLERLAKVVGLRLRVDVDAAPMMGAGGGVGAGLAAFLGADLRNGFAFVAQQLDLAQAVADADLVVTGEGTLDDGSLLGKVTTGVAELAGSAGVPVIAVCGRIDLDEPDLDSFGFANTVDVSSLTGARALSAPANSVAEATGRALENLEG